MVEFLRRAVIVVRLPLNAYLAVSVLRCTETQSPMDINDDLLWILLQADGISACTR